MASLSLAERWTITEIRRQSNSVLTSGLSLRAGGRGFSPATKRVAPGYFYWKTEEKYNQKKSLAV